MTLGTIMFLSGAILFAAALIVMITANIILSVKGGLFTKAMVNTLHKNRLRCII